MDEVNQQDQQQGAEVAQSGEPAAATAQASSETNNTASSGADATLADVGLEGASNESSDESPTASTEGSTTGSEAEEDAEPHPVRTYADVLRGKFQRAEAVAMSDIERLLDLIEEHL